MTGLTRTDRRLFTGATDKVDAEKARLSGVADISRSLEGQAAGVSVQNVSGPRYVTKDSHSWCYLYLW